MSGESGYERQFLVVELKYIAPFQSFGEGVCRPMGWAQVDVEYAKLFSVPWHRVEKA